MLKHMKKSTNVKLTGFLCAAAFMATGIVNAQEPANYGRLSGSFETNTIWYMPDSLVYNNGNPMPADRIGSNNYLKLDYTLGKFSAGVQGELYAPVLSGYQEQYKGGKITNKYASWTDDNFFVTVGDFYDQYGSGLIFRAYEDRALGMNSAVEGVRAGMNIGDAFAIRAMLGRPRLYMDYAPSWLRGADATLALSSLFGFKSQYLALEGSFLSQYDAARLNITNPEGQRLLSSDMSAWSARMVYEAAGFSGRVELVGKTPGAYLVDGIDMAYFGRAQLIELGYSGYGWGISLTGRNVSHMDMKLTDSKDLQYSGLGNVLNYIPALTRQYTYSLANLDPFQVKTKGERAAQMDIFYNIRRGSQLGGRYGTKLHVNASLIYQPKDVYYVGKVPEDAKEMNFVYLDASFDFEKQWNKQFKTTFLFAFQRMMGEEWTMVPINRYVFALDELYKFNTKHSLRLELQYLYSPFVTMETTGAEGPVQERLNDKRNNGDWWAAQLEYSFAPVFSVFVSDMYNFQLERVHYYNVGVSYTKSRTRIALSYGRNRAGYVCSGGVCRQMPAYTGFNLSLTTSF